MGENINLNHDNANNYNIGNTPIHFKCPIWFFNTIHQSLSY